MLAAAHPYVTRTYRMDLTSKMISRLTAPGSLLTAWGFFAFVLVLTLVGEAPRVLLRFVSIWSMAVSLSAAVRVVGGSASRGDNWNGTLATAALPYFDGELEHRARFGVGKVERLLAALLLCGAGLAGTVLLTAGQPAEDGIVVLGTDGVESWQDSSRPGLARELGVSVRASSVDLHAGHLELSVDRFQDGWENGATLSPGQTVGLGGLELEWIGLTPNEAVDGVGARVSVNGAEVETTFVVGRPVAVGEAQVVMSEFHENRYGALGPAGLFVVREGEETRSVWAFLWGGEGMQAHAESGIGIELTGLQPSSSPVLRVRSATSPLMFPLISVFLALMALFGARLLARPVSLRGKSGDYELVGLSRGAVDSAAQTMLGSDGASEWRSLLDSIRRTSRGA